MQNAPQGFLRLAGHPLRWRLLTELARTDRQVRELTGLLGQPQSLVSYHLGQLRAAARCRRGAVRPTAGTPITGSNWPAVASCWPRPGWPSILASVPGPV